MRTHAMALVALVLAPASTAAAQRREAPGGLWYSVGVAPGWERVTCDICAGHRRTGLSAFIGGGGRTDRALRIGGERAAGREGDGGVAETLLSFAGAAYWYPGVRRRPDRRGGAVVR